METFADAFANDDMVAVELDDGSEYYVKSGMLVSASDYLAKILKKRRDKDMEDRHLRLEDCDNDVFVAFLYWIHHKSLPGLYGPPSHYYLENTLKEDEKLLHSHKGQEMLVRLWRFADTCRMKDFKDAIVNSLLDILARWGTTYDMVVYAYDHAPEGSIIRKMFATQGLYDRFRQPSDRPFWRHEVDETFQRHSEFAADLVVAIRDYNGDWTESQSAFMDDFRPGAGILREREKSAEEGESVENEDSMDHDQD
ncbi:hypothetical protein BDY17DRAFT_324355 [Neohortaea acidophila]|uniref:BTB domain-containing protein n=1 Tax=Neohortaea acidophila TaxID=245834 RepID=A0A6A6PUM7_9PEZI|nr:uncharacterized protein BDY17DRAFT_324355 [Neohortaea acidophila]KAF2483635.1 hypothetical protein BDY17DRAFT_324355 [Neohortaea acidophila]